MLTHFVLAISMPFGAAWQHKMPSATGDARLASQTTSTAADAMFQVRLPPGDHNGMTVTAWARTSYTGDMFLTTACDYTPEAVQRFNPDLLGGMVGHPSGTNLTGTVTVGAFPWQPYTDSTISNIYPQGVYTLAGWSSNAVTVTLGGTEVVVGPGAFNRNVNPGGGAACVIAGSGPAAVGISRTPASQWFGHVDGVRDELSDVLTGDSIVTNEISFCVWRIRLDQTTHLYRSDLARVDQQQCMGAVSTNSMPLSGRRTLSGAGIYKVGLRGLKVFGEPITMELFDLRVTPRWLTDEEVCRIHTNGIEEILHRGIPKFK
jgi:hypothetical protein